MIWGTTGGVVADGGGGEEEGMEDCWRRANGEAGKSVGIHGTCLALLWRSFSFTPFALSAPYLLTISASCLLLIS